MGVGAGRALDTVLSGAPQPKARDKRDPDEMRAWLLAADPDPERWDYEEAARYVGRVILEAFLADPRLASVPTETVYDWDEIKKDPRWTTAHGVEVMKEHVIAEGLYETLKQRDPSTKRMLETSGLTGFQWGWAVNAARYCVELPPAPNPAILTI